MKIKILTKEDNYFMKLLMLLDSIPPFNKVNYKELLLYSFLMEYNHSYKTIPLDARNRLIFNYTTRNEMARRIGSNLPRVYNLMKGLRRAGIIDKSGLVPKYIIPKTSKLVFLFEDDE